MKHITQITEKRLGEMMQDFNNRGFTFADLGEWYVPYTLGQAFALNDLLQQQKYLHGCGDGTIKECKKWGIEFENRFAFTNVKGRFIEPIIRGLTVNYENVIYYTGTYDLDNGTVYDFNYLVKSIYDKYKNNAE